MTVIIDYKMGNLGSITNMLRRLGVASVVSSERNVIESATKLILPGVGAFDSGMRHLNELKIRDILEKKVLLEKTPFLGICLGMQLMTDASEEGQEKGLGWVSGQTLRFASRFNGMKLRIPHMGWNEIAIQKGSTILCGFTEQPRFYFVHGYYVACKDPGVVAATTRYGIEFHSSFQLENIYGVQFHPEKSHKFGMQLLKNFSDLAA